MRVLGIGSQSGEFRLYPYKELSTLSFSILEHEHLKMVDLQEYFRQDGGNPLTAQLSG